MLISDLTHFACPRCLSPLQARPAAQGTPPPGFESDSMLWSGGLHCSGCDAVYPLVEGVACLAAFDTGWLVPLKEMESRISLTLRSLEPRPWESGREELLAKAPRILDVGAGTCRTTEEFILRGAQAIAVDVDLPQLRYLSFEGIDQLPPPSFRHEASGQILHFKEPNPLSRYLTRVFADIGRLPFADASFDIVFCRSVLHHLDGHERTMREMARVLKPGGKMLFCAEPVRSVFEVEDLCYDRCVEREEGMNERVWPLWRFLGPIWKMGRKFQVHTWPQPPSPVLRRRVPLLAAWLARRIGPGARVKGWQLLAMPFVNAAVSIYGERTQDPCTTSRLPPATPQEQSDLERYCDLFRVEPDVIREATADLPRKRLAVNAIRRGMLARFAPPVAALRLAEVPMHQLDRGWLDPADCQGRLGRPMAREAWLTLGSPQPRRLLIEVASPAGAPAALHVEANGIPCGEFFLHEAAWMTFEIAIPAGLDSIISFHFATLPAASPTGSTAPPSEATLIMARAVLS